MNDEEKEKDMNEGEDADERRETGGRKEKMRTFLALIAVFPSAERRKSSQGSEAIRAAQAS